ncbi:leucyl aminopeptidase [Microbacterium sp. zg.Y1090]|uniref:leucyl aminopeptidase n=1 Tax=Microbacterium TaxID=33882 RepID=UPI00214B2997|nr:MULTISPECIES: leucyl aminopeptidase [unclassified Microbacterium]MCR2811832.1 leucyl aminopeptidase [Microbacterium sp. zg.Y1084]MCR2818729.1 leucyl aminopeptidase [Microbacterium sp. zg.Y1090]MDL5486542.1 leucyl aminopeptidase [Microbacterium sp. zg-Y1211]WIM27048.1 leucyl aminopeptidase [Microbacterium sp. zg-Y1090]
MPFPELAHSTRPLTEAEADALVLALPPLDAAGDALQTWPGLADALTAFGFTGAPGAQQRLFLPQIAAVPLIVVGTGKEPDAAAIRDAVGAAVRTATGFDTLAVAAPLATGDPWRAAAEGAVLGGYRFAGYKSDEPASQRAKRVVLHTPTAPAEADVAAVAALGEAVALVKDLVNIPAEWLSPADFADRSIDAVADLPVTVTVLDEEQLREQGFGGILGVGQGSDRPPRFVQVDYAPANAERHIAVVGKGITFDTGGLSLKPAASMVGMKYDMCGAAVALAVVRAAAAMQLPVRVSGWLCLSDNMPSGRATRPGDVLRMLDGTTVEVLNTDAEGRLVLADGLVAASRAKPDVLVDIATLTGAITVALGTRHTGVMGEDAAVQAFLSAAERAGEAAWPLPLPPHMREELDSPIADLQNAKIGDPAGGSLFAGLFLQHFVGRVSDEPEAERIPWVHLDIAGAGWNKGSGFGATDKGPTGTMVRSLLEFIAAGGR